MGQTSSAPADTVQRATIIKTFDDLNKLTEINGVSLQEIDKRAAPGGESWAFSGFIGPNQTFLECLMLDWQIVRGLGLTHIALAEGLRKFLGCTQDEEYSWVERSFDRAELLPSLNLSSETQSFAVYYSQTRGFQDSIFKNDDRPESEESTQELDADVIIYNKKLYDIGLTLHFGANGEWKRSQLDWIERYGFYEGGDVNEYRLDPRFIVATLTGQPPQGEALDALIARLEGQLEQPLSGDDQLRISAQLANARGLRTPGYVPKPVPPPSADE
eukprot:TRINITY_DN4853_c0_g1_i1.p1 TRINITY_DN4853_c0_g1~~TRINITY_DN4853_c0_g1_i1.p1  ORF type:complete len:273 (+),score=37.27 TRINITY_DN4853_c0_g1_i1:92-910(+)